MFLSFHASNDCVVWSKFLYFLALRSNKADREYSPLYRPIFVRAYNVSFAQQAPYLHQLYRDRNRHIEAQFHDQKHQKHPKSASNHWRATTPFFPKEMLEYILTLALFLNEFLAN